MPANNSACSKRAKRSSCPASKGNRKARTKRNKTKQKQNPPKGGFVFGGAICAAAEMVAGVGFGGAARRNRRQRRHLGRITTTERRRRQAGRVAKQNRPKAVCFDGALCTAAEMVAGVGFEPHDLRVMSPTSYRTALPRGNRIRGGKRVLSYSIGKGGRCQGFF